MLTTTLIFITGVITGVAAYHFYSMKFKQHNDLQQQLKQVKQQHTQYQQQVGEHFEKTAGMLQTLNQQYQGIEQHLQQGSEQFALENITIDASSNQVPPLSNLQNQPAKHDSQSNNDKTDNIADKLTADNEAASAQPEVIVTPLDYVSDDNKTP